MNSLAVITTDKKLAAKLLKWLKEQPKVDTDSTAIYQDIGDYNLAVDIIAKLVDVEGNSPETFYIDDSDFMDNLSEDIEDAAFKLREKELEDENDI